MQGPALRRPLNLAETHELTEFLANVPGALPFWEAHGFLTAIGSAPTTLLPSVWQPVLLGDVNFSSLEHANRIFGLVARLYDEILTDLHAGSPIAPYESEEDMVSWCAGYVTAAHMDDVWIADEDGAFFLYPIAIVAGDVNLIGEKDADGNIIEDPTPQIQRCRDSIGYMVRRANEYWTGWRRTNMVAPASARPLKIGRNEPCPCGSGRKFKKCCALTVH